MSKDREAAGPPRGETDRARRHAEAMKTKSVPELGIEIEPATEEVGTLGPRPEAPETAADREPDPDMVGSGVVCTEQEDA